MQLLLIRDRNVTDLRSAEQKEAKRRRKRKNRKKGGRKTYGNVRYRSFKKGRNYPFRIDGQEEKRDRVGDWQRIGIAVCVVGKLRCVAFRAISSSFPLIISFAACRCHSVESNQMDGL